MLPGPAASASLGNLLEMHIISSIQDLLDQKLQEEGPATGALTSPPGDSYGLSSIHKTVLKLTAKCRAYENINT